MRNPQPFYFGLIIRYAFTLAGLFIVLDLIFYAAGWDLFALSGLAKFFFKGLIFPMAVGLPFIYALLRKQGSATMMGVLSHIILICILHTSVVSIYSYVFNAWIAPDHYYTVKEAYRAGLIENAKALENMKHKSDFLEQANRLEKELQQFKSEPRDIQHLWLKPLFYMLPNYLVFALLFGTVFGFIFSKMRVSVQDSK
jgi:hypothetical protein